MTLQGSTHGRAAKPATPFFIPADALRRSPFVLPTERARWFDPSGRFVPVAFADADIVASIQPIVARSVSSNSGGLDQVVTLQVGPHQAPHDRPSLPAAVRHSDDRVAISPEGARVECAIGPWHDLTVLVNDELFAPTQVRQAMARLLAEHQVVFERFTNLTAIQSNLVRTPGNADRRTQPR